MVNSQGKKIIAKALYLTPPDAAFLKECGTSWGVPFSVEEMQIRGFSVLVGTIELDCERKQNGD